MDSTHNAKGEMVDGSEEEERIIGQERSVVICRMVLVFLRLYPRRHSPYYVVYYEESASKEYNQTGKRVVYSEQKVLMRRFTTSLVTLIWVFLRVNLFDNDQLQSLPCTRRGEGSGGKGPWSPT